MHSEITQHSPEQQRLLQQWLYLALGSLIIPGITAILLVVLRTVSSEAATGWGDLFRTALVIHVDLSVFVWFLATAGLFWMLFSRSENYTIPHLSFWAITLGTLILATAPLLGATTPVLNNYLPVLDHPLFFVGMALIWVGATLFALHILNTHLQNPADNNHYHWATLALAITILIAAAALLITWIASSNQSHSHHYFEQLFWGAGHLLQFSYVLLLLIGWKMMLEQLQWANWLHSTLFRGLLLLALLPLLYVFWLYGHYLPLSPEITIGFAQLMRYGNGLAPGLMGLLILYTVWQSRKISSTTQIPIRNALYASLLLFASGGILALMIDGINTIIPAHYHGSIVGITLALMGVIYLLLPHLGYAAADGRIARVQPLVYAIGQLIHIAGLALSGQQGAQRKTAGVSVEAMNSLSEQLGLLLTRSGGLIAVVGGILFLVVCWRAMRSSRSTYP